MFRLGDILSLCLVVAAFTNGFKFPSDIPRCKYSDTECLRTVATRVLRTHGVKGHEGLNLVPFEPFYIDSFAFDRIHRGPVDVQLDLNDADISRSLDATVLRLSGFTKKASDLVFEMHFHYPKFILSGLYSIEGFVSDLPIDGQGHGTITFEDTIFIARVNCSTRVKRRRTYLNVDRIDVDMRPNRVIFSLENLFHGNKGLGNYVNRVLNERWPELFKQIKSSFENNLGTLGTKIIGGPFAAIPYDELFL